MKKPAVWFIFLLALSGCATTNQFVPFPDQAKDVSRPDKGRIYVMRPERMFGGALSFDILDGDTLIGQLAGGGVVSWEREPGQAEFKAGRMRIRRWWTSRSRVGTPTTFCRKSR